MRRGRRPAILAGVHEGPKPLRIPLAPALLAFLLAGAPAAARPPVETPKRLANGWFYGEAGNYCMAIRELGDGTRLTMRLARWNDMSDSLILWAPGLPALDLEDESAAERFHDLEVRIDGRTVPRAMHSTMLEEFDQKPGPSYRLGIAQRPFIAALARGRTLEIRRAGRRLAVFPVAGSAAMAKAFAACVEKPPSL